MIVIPARWAKAVEPPTPAQRIADYRRRLAAAGYDPRDLARRAAAGIAIQDGLRARNRLREVVERINPDLAPPRIRSTRENGLRADLFTPDQVCAA